MKPSVRADQAAALIPDGASVMIGGFMGVGAPDRLIEALLEAGARDLTLIANDTATPTRGVGKLVARRRLKRAVVSHIGLNPETQRQMMAGELEVDLVPQGTLVERIRAAGFGLGGVLTQTGLGTLAAEGRQTVEVEGETYLIETPLRADVALVHARQADYVGNLDYSLTAQNFNPIIAMAARTVIVEAREIVPVGVIPPDQVKTPGAVVDYILERAA